ncbi:hypothetical protein SAMN02910301_1479 [Lachnospiraceae bacterium XBD2001]|nr:hypothetical protein SAMN02910301_1479 [Lachnospiraceae bacterium XBD2001]
MMSNKIKRNAIKAASVGMAAMMAATPLTAFAAEETPVEGANSVEATKLVAPEGTSETYRAEGATKVAEAATKDANEKLEVAGNELQKAAGTTNPKTEVNAGEAALADVATQLDNIKNANADVVKNEGLNNTAAGDAKTVASDEKTAAQTSADEFNGHADAVATAGTVADAQAQYDAAAKAAETAQNDYNNASARLEELKGQIETNDQVVADAQAHYDAAVENADKDVAKAEEELAAAKKLATDLQTAANAEREKLAQSAAARIVAEQQARDAHVGENGKVKSGESQAFWTDNDTLFYDIIQNYYVPVVKNAKFVSADEKFTRPRANVVGATRAHDENGNYYKVVCEIDGEQQTLYMNYKVEGNKLVIFEKVFVNEDIYYYKDAKGTMHDVDTTASNVVTINSAKYLLKDNGKKTDVVEVGNTSDDGATVVTNVVDDGGFRYEVDKTTGNVVKITTGTVTKVTTTGKTLDGSEEKFNTEAEAIAAGKNAAAKDVKSGETLVEGSEQVTVGSETKYTYDVNYAAKFTATIDLSGITRTRETWRIFTNNTEDVASDIAEEEKEKYRKLIENAGFTILDTDVDVSVVDANELDETHEKEGSFLGVHYKETIKDADGYRTTDDSHITFTFTLKATPGTTYISANAWDLISSILGNRGEKESMAAANALELDGPVLSASRHVIDGKIGRATVNYTAAGVASAGKVTVTDKASATATAGEAAQASIDQTAIDLKNKLGDRATVTGRVWEDSVKAKNETAKTTYSYDKVDYKVTTSKDDVKQDIARTVYDTQDLTKLHVEGYYGNDNYTRRNGLFFEATDAGFNNFLNDYKQNKQNADNIAQKAQDAVTAYGEAQKKVQTLKNELASLKSTSVAGDDIARAEEKARIESELTAAELDLEAAKANVDAIVSRMAGLATVLENRIAFLTPAPAAPAAPAAAGGVVVGGANPAAAQGAGLVRLNPIAAPLANNTLDNGDDAAEEDVNLQQVVNSNDVTTALSDMTLEDDAKANTILGWWWLLIVAVLGGTGYTMYRKFQQKKAAEKIDKTK